MVQQEPEDLLERQQADKTIQAPTTATASYINPATGEPLLFPTMSFRAQLLNDGPTDPNFHNSVEVYFVIEGEDAIHVGDEALE